MHTPHVGSVHYLPCAAACMHDSLLACKRGGVSHMHLTPAWSATHPPHPLPSISAWACTIFQVAQRSHCDRHSHKCAHMHACIYARLLRQRGAWNVQQQFRATLCLWFASISSFSCHGHPIRCSAHFSAADLVSCARACNLVGFMLKIILIAST